MVDKIIKALKKLSPKERINIKKILLNLQARKINDCDLKKLKGRKDIFRIRKEKIRIIYRINENNQIFLLAIEKRNDTLYNS